MPSSSAPTRECWPEEAARCGGRTPAKPSWSEVIVFREVFLRLKVPLVEAPIRFKECYKRQSYLDELSSHRSWASGISLSSFGRMLAGAGGGGGSCPPTNESSAEVATSAARLLRRGQPLRELGLSSGERASHRSWASGISLSSCGRMLAGAGRGCGGCPPTNEGSSDVATSSARLLRRRKPL